MAGYIVRPPWVQKGRNQWREYPANPAKLRESKAWRGFEPGRWRTAIDVRDFIVRNVTSYEGDEAFLVGPSARELWLSGNKLQPYFEEERRKGVLDVEADDPIHHARPRARLDRSRQ